MSGDLREFFRWNIRPIARLIERHARQSKKEQGATARSGKITRRRDDVYEAKMDDAVDEPEKKNCTFLFKRRKIRSNAARKRKEADDDDGESR